MEPSLNISIWLVVAVVVALMLVVVAALLLFVSRRRNAMPRWMGMPDFMTPPEEVTNRELPPGSALRDEVPAGVIRAIGDAGGYRLVRALGEGPFAWVWLGESPDKSARRAFKIAKPLDEAGRLSGTAPRGTHLTRAMAWVGSGLHTEVRPDPFMLLAAQARWLRAIDDPCVVAVDDARFDNEHAYYRMEYVEGWTLRELIGAEQVPVRRMVELVRCAERLSRVPGAGAHCDLKPENVIVTSSGIKVIDPGYIGPLDTDRGNLDRVEVTTLDYYPSGGPDDLLALGIVLWETVCHRHPFDAPSNPRTTPLGEGLERQIGMWRMAPYYLAMYENVRRPCELRRGLDREIEAVLLKGLRLRLAPARSGGDVIETDAGYGSIGELAEALAWLERRGVTAF